MIPFESHGADPWNVQEPAYWRDLARAHGTPFYMFDADGVEKRIDAVRSAFAGVAQVYFAVKCNPNLGLLRALSGRADGADISSGGELAQALAAGFHVGRLSFAGPGKTECELAAAIESGVGAISVESRRELLACTRLAQGLGRPARVLLRVNPLLPSRAYGLKMGGRAVQFGTDEEHLHSIEQLALQGRPWIDLLGLHCYVGSQAYDASGVAECTRNALRIADEMVTRTGITLRKVNLGGGFGVTSSEPSRELNVRDLAEVLAPSLRAFRAAHRNCELIFELGRYVAAAAGIYVTAVVDRKLSRGKRFVVCDGGLNHHLGAAGTFGAALRGNFPMRNLSRPDAPAVNCNVAGPSCNPTDLLGVDISVGDPQEGDLLAVTYSGAYGLTASPLLFLGRDSPVELVRSSGCVTVGRRRFTMADFN